MTQLMEKVRLRISQTTPRTVVALAFGVGCMLALLVVLKDALTVQKHVAWQPGQASTWIDPLFPPGRFDAPKQGKQVMRQEPGYTDIRIPKGYTTITLALELQNPDTIPVQYGFATSEGAYELYAQPHTFSIKDLTLLPGNRARLIISAPELRMGKAPLIVQSINISYGKE